MKTTFSTAALYGFIVLIGGLIGYFNAGSTVSVVMGSTSAALLFLAAGMIYYGYAFGLTLLFLLSLLLSFLFVYRFSCSGAWIPSGVMTVVSLVVLAIAISNLFFNGKK